MIRHRFILQSKEDFQIFCAIPVENTVLTWKHWMRPADWEMLKKCAVESAELIDKIIHTLNNALAGFIRLNERTSFENIKEFPFSTPRMGENVQEIYDHYGNERKAEADKISKIIDSYQHSSDSMKALIPTLEEDSFEKRVLQIAEIATIKTTILPNIDFISRDVRESIEKLVAEVRGELRTMKMRKTAREGAEAILHGYTAILNAFDVTIEARRALLDLSDGVLKLFSSEPFPTTPCPTGVPFAAYTIEFEQGAVNIIEGLAWIEGREATPSERTVTEIVTQMLVERSLNPKADTRVPIREVDPKHAHQTREAEKRGAPGVRTIKFAVTPPRYLREAAERILSSPRRAHWVIGHWRNQPWGFRNQLRKQMWIAPHIRGLGEASATLTTVVAPRKQETQS